MINARGIPTTRRRMEISSIILTPRKTLNFLSIEIQGFKH
jgi:hypothetical protein